MHFPTFTVSTMALAILFLSATTSAASSFDACDRCIDQKMISVEPACAKLPKNITKSKNGDFLTAQHYKCYCGVPSGKAFYKSCKTKNKCSGEDINDHVFFLSLVADKKTCRRRK